MSQEFTNYGKNKSKVFHYTYILNVNYLKSLFHPSPEIFRN